MFKNHPLGLYTLAITNTCERFGHYTMLAVLTLFLQVKFGLTAANTATILGVFLGVVYFTPLIGGILADKRWGYRKTIKIGIFIMFLGYFLLAFCVKMLDKENIVLTFVFLALLIISIGIGFFKGNLQVLVGNLYDSPERECQRDNAFSIYYMALNIGTFFAPTVAEKITNFILNKNGLFYDAKIPALTHQFLNGTIDPQGMVTLTHLASLQQVGITDLITFSHFYINKLSESYDCVFWMACLVHITLMLSYLFFRGTYAPTASYSKNSISNLEETKNLLPPKKIKEKIGSLIRIYLIVILFWMSFDQNWLTLTFFARDYTVSSILGLNRIEFDVVSLSLILLAEYSFFGVFQSENKRWKWIFGSILIIAIISIFIKYNCYTKPIISISPEIFQQFNPFFVMALTPVFVCLFSFLANKKKEFSAPFKIGMGAIVASFGYAILAIGSISLKTPAELESLGGVSSTLVSPNWLIITYFTLTSAELLLSPVAISFVSKVSPPQYKGVLMGGWFVSTAIGGYLVSLIGYLWNTMQLWIVWGILMTCCLLSASYTFSVIKKLKKVSE